MRCGIPNVYFGRFINSRRNLDAQHRAADADCSLSVLCRKLHFDAQVIA